ncbi:MAG: hypothetical protein IKR74_03615 [Bacilli bacterium]|nr:hypothetical protein [Bacilli bacterium]
MNIRDSEQRIIIAKIRNGDKEARENYILHYYERIKGTLVRLQIPEEYHEDILHDCIIAVMGLIEEIDLNKQSHVCQKFNVKIVEQIAKSLACIFVYSKKVNGKKVNSPSIYLRNKDVRYTNYDIIEEYLSDGKLPEMVIADKGTSLRDTEDRVINRQIENEYWGYVDTQSPLKQEIITGRMPITDFEIESFGKIAERNNCSRAYINQEASRQRKLLLRSTNLRWYLK